MAEDTTTLTATCHCRASTLSFTVENTDLPMPTHFCHCSICRKTHGTLATIHTPIPAPTVDLSSFTTYPSTSHCIKFFCTTCGAHMLDRATYAIPEAEGGGTRDQWYVATSLVEGGEGEANWKHRGHFWLQSTKDGGLANWLSAIRGTELPLWYEGSKSQSKSLPPGAELVFTSPPPGSSEAVEEEHRDKKEGEDRLKAKCHCGGVEFWISRPEESDWATMPANMIPKLDRGKWYALSDVCHSCRLTSSSFVVSWTFPTTSKLSLPDGSAWKPVFGTAKSYSSSKGVLRTFCGTCGATVSYACDDRPDMVDVAVGLLESEAGVLAEDWLEWRTEKVGYVEDAVWKTATDNVAKGLKEWGGKRGL